MNATRADVAKLLSEQSGIRLDIGCGGSKNEGFVGMDARALPNVDIVWDVTRFPWPLPDESVVVAVTSHLVEHIPPDAGDTRVTGLIELLLYKNLITEAEIEDFIGEIEPGPRFIRFMDEVWRVMKYDGEFAIACPHGYSPGFLQDPSHCLLEGAEVLTADGFKDFRDVAPGELLLTLDLETERTEFAPCVRVIREPYDGPILRFQNHQTHLAVTPNHDLVWRTWNRSHGYRKTSADTFMERSPFSRKGLRTIPDWQGDSDGDGDFMELLGWILSEGGFSRNGHHVVIHQSTIANPEKASRIADLLQRLQIPYRVYADRQFVLQDRALYDQFSVLGKQPDRYIPTAYKNKNPELLGRLLESLLLGDGEVHGHGNGWTYTTVSHRLAQDVSEISVKCGLAARVMLRPGKEFLAPNGKQYIRRDQYRVSIGDAHQLCYPQPQEEHYQGYIVCAEVERNHTLLTRFQGHIAWTGNCNEISETTFAYFDPLEPNTGGALYRIYSPKPWRIKSLVWSPAANMEVVLVKRRIDSSYGGQP